MYANATHIAMMVRIVRHFTIKFVGRLQVKSLVAMGLYVPHRFS